MICTASDFEGSELYKYAYTENKRSYGTINSSVRSCTNTRIPKHISQYPDTLYWFGAVQILHIPKLSKESASGLNRFGVVQILHIPKPIFRFTFTPTRFGAVQIHIYKTESLYYLPKNLVRSYTNTHIQKLCSLSTM